MGWFDDDDSDDSDEEEEKEPVAKPAADETLTLQPLNDDEEDPLDAYMKSLEQAAAPSVPRAERLDVDNDDEATSHWKETDLNEEIEDSSAVQQQQAPITFLKAGANKQQTNVSIHLDPVQHDQMKYSTFQQVFLVPKDTAIGQAWRLQESVVCTPTAMDPITSFHDDTTIAALFGTDLRERIRTCGYTNPTPVQAQTLAVALAGRDALVTASTGSGKTLAYVWPMVVHIQHQTQKQGPMGLVLTPTRELALQVHKQVKSMIKSTIAITGGVNRYQLVQDLKRNPAHIVVATPGRLLDVLSIKKNGLSLKNVTFLVLDECDRMLDMGFESQVKEILNQVRPDRQSLLLSATLGRRVEQVAQQWLKKPIRYVCLFLFCFCKYSM